MMGHSFKIMFAVFVWYSVLCTCTSFAASLNGTSVAELGQKTSDGVLAESSTNLTLELEATPRLYYMSDLCGKTLLLKTRNAIRMAPWNDKYPHPGIICTVGVKSDVFRNYQLVTTFKSVNMAAPDTRGICVNSRLDLFNGESTQPSQLISGPSGICGKYAKKRQYATTQNTLSLRYQTSRSFVRSFQYFEEVITPFHYGNCARDEYKCANRKCILKTLVCNSYDNCGDGSDEKGCASFVLSIAAIIGIVVGCVIFVSIFCTIFICCCCCAACGYERL